MVKRISFGKTVKYQGSIYPPNTVFEVLDDDVKDLKKAGGWVVESDILFEAKEDISESTEKLGGSKILSDIKENTTNTKESPKGDTKKSKYELLREEADRLGIEYKSNWGIKKLTEAIAKAKREI